MRLTDSVSFATKNLGNAWDISDEYTAALVEEVTQHLVEVVVEYEGLDQDSTAAHFIRAKVSQTIRDKLASLDVADKKETNKKTKL